MKKQKVLNFIVILFVFAILFEFLIVAPMFDEDYCLIMERHYPDSRSISKQWNIWPPGPACVVEHTDGHVTVVEPGYHFLIFLLLLFGYPVYLVFWFASKINISFIRYMIRKVLPLITIAVVATFLCFLLGEFVNGKAFLITICVVFIYIYIVPVSIITDWIDNKFFKNRRFIKRSSIHVLAGALPFWIFGILVTDWFFFFDGIVGAVFALFYWMSDEFLRLRLT